MALPTPHLMSLGSDSDLPWGHLEAPGPDDFGPTKGVL